MATTSQQAGGEKRQINVARSDDAGADDGISKKKIKNEPGTSSRNQPSSNPTCYDSSSALKKTFHGTYYQALLLMLVKIRAENTGHEFSLATEMDDAEKFDDVVYKCEKSNFRFFQIKHLQDNVDPKITIQDLKKKVTDEKNPFSLLKYFISFYKIRRKDNYNSPKDFFIITNAQFKPDAEALFEEEDLNGENALKGDDLLYFESESFQAKKFKLNITKIKDIMNESIDDTLKVCTSKKNETKKNVQIKTDINNLKSQSQELKDFCKKFSFITNFPNEKQLEQLIIDELGKKFKLKDPELVFGPYLKNVFHMLKNTEGPKQAKFYTKDCADKLLNKINGLIVTLTVSGSTKSYTDELNELDQVEYQKEPILELQNLINTFESILILNTESTRLSATKVFCALEPMQFPNLNEISSPYKEMDSYIFTSLTKILGKQAHIDFLEAFRQPNRHNLLVVECQQRNKKTTKEEKLFKRLSEVLMQSKKEGLSKRLILIVQNRDSFAEMFENKSVQSETDSETSSDEDTTSDRRKLSSNDRKLSQMHLSVETAHDDKTSFKYFSNKEIFLKKCTVNLQGKSLCLDQLMSADAASELIDNDILCELLERKRNEKEIMIGDTKPFTFVDGVEHYYVDRQFYGEIIQDSVFQEKNELFFVTGADSNTLHKLGAKIVEEWKEGNIYNKGIIYPPSGQSDYETNKEIFRNLGNHAHWLEFKESHWFWRESKMNSFKLDKHVVKNNILDENRFVDQTKSKKIVLLANDPGAGKSSLLTSIAEKMKGLDVNMWIVRINLTDYSDTLKVNKFKDNETKKAIEFITNAAVKGDSGTVCVKLQKELLENSLQSDKKEFKLQILILLDGFDEICPGHRDNTVNLIKAIKKTDARIWITTRQHEEFALENKLEISAQKLKPLTKKSQIELLNKLQKRKLKFPKEFEESETPESEENVYKEIIKNLRETDVLTDDTPLIEDNSKILESFLKNVNHSIKLEILRKAIDKLNFNDYFMYLLEKWNETVDEKFTENPLHLNMLFVVKEKIDFNTKLQLFDIYDAFIDIKFKDFFDNKMRHNSNIQGNEWIQTTVIDSLRTTHNLLAVQLMLPEKYQMCSGNFVAELDKLKIEQRDNIRVGLLILRGNGFEFVHRSFAEYFFSKYLLTQFSNEKFGEILFEKVLLEKEYKLTRQFLNGQISVQTLLVNTVKKSKESCSDKVHKVFGIICKEGHDTILNVILENIKDNCEIQKELMTYQGYLEQNTVLHVSINNEHYKVVEILLKYSGNFDIKTLTTILLQTNHNGWHSFDYANVYHLNNEVFDKLRKCAVDCVTEKLNSQSNGIGSKALWLAIFSKNIELVKRVVACASNINVETLTSIMSEYDKKGRNAIQLANDFGNVEMIGQIVKYTRNINTEISAKMLLQHGKNAINLKDKNDEITDKCAYDIVKKILHIQIPDYNMHSKALWLTILKENVELLTQVVEHARGFGKDFLTNMMLQTDEIGCNALQLAAQHENVEMVQQILDHARNINIDILTKMMLQTDELDRNVFKITKHLNNGNYKVIVKLREYALHTVTNILDSERILTDYKIGNNALCLAISIQNIELVTQIVEVARDVGINFLKNMMLQTDRRGHNALRLAIDFEYVEVVGKLLEHVRNINTGILTEMMFQTADYGFNAFDYAFQFIQNNEIIDKLRKFSSDCITEILNSKSLQTEDEIDSKTLWLAILSQNIELFTELVEHVCKVNTDNLSSIICHTDNFGRNALHLAIYNKNDHVVGQLLKQAEEINTGTLKKMILQSDKNDRIALHLLIRYSNDQVIGQLLEKAKEIDIETITEMLIHSDVYGKNAFEYAFQFRNGNIDIIKKLEKYAHDTVIEILTSQKIQTDYKIGSKALWLSISSRNIILVKQVDEYVRNINRDIFSKILLHTDKHGRNALTLAKDTWTNI